MIAQFTETRSKLYALVVVLVHRKCELRIRLRICFWVFDCEFAIQYVAPYQMGPRDRNQLCS